MRALLAPMVGLSPAEIDPDANLVVLGLGSLEIMRLVSTWRRAKVAVEFDVLVASPTLNSWLDHLRAMEIAR